MVEIIPFPTQPDPTSAPNRVTEGRITELPEEQCYPAIYAQLRCISEADPLTPKDLKKADELLGIAATYSRGVPTTFRLCAIDIAGRAIDLCGSYPEIMRCCKEVATGDDLSKHPTVMTRRRIAQAILKHCQSPNETEESAK